MYVAVTQNGSFDITVLKIVKDMSTDLLNKCFVL